MKKILSFDCGNKTLAACGVLYDPARYAQFLDLLPELQIMLEKATAQIMDTTREEIVSIIASVNEKLFSAIKLFFDTWKIEYMSCRDIIPGKKIKETSIPERCAALREAISETNLKFSPDIVFIEEQPPKNDKMRGLMYCLTYEYGNKVKLIDAKEKNKINIGGLPYCDFIGKYSTSYLANKAHTSANFKVVASLWNLQIPAREISHIADAYTQLVAITMSQLK